MVYFRDLPCEVILKVISYLGIKDLIRCGQASKRILDRKEQLDSNHGLRTPNEGINQRYLKNWADAADKICCPHT